MAWTIDPAHTTVGFSARHLGLTTVRGRFTRFSGEIDIDPADLSSASGTVVVDLNSVDTGNEQRDGHLKGTDFFGGEENPTLTFTVTSVRPEGDGYVVAGDLTIKGITRPVELSLEDVGQAADPWGGRRLGGTLRGTIDRRDWGLKWNVAVDAGGLLVSEKVKIEVDGQLTEVTEPAEAEAAAGVA
jgi:polyisoprenoid-binding protein YceI